MKEKIQLINSPKKRKIPTKDELDIVQVLAKIKGIVVRKQIRILDSMENFDIHNELCISANDFRRGLNTSGIREISEPEVGLICHVYETYALLLF